MTTQREKAAVPLAASGFSNAETRVPARGKAALSSATQRLRTLLAHWLALARQSALTHSEAASVWSLSPASPRELRAYILSSAWVPGDAPILEIAGRVYGYLIAIPVSLALYTAAWLLQRPGRFLLVAVLGLLIWLTA